ncbi:AP4A-like protein [Mya arenaria]|uniref:Bis(5'-nucleosyl)-tetraphosphatase [asymmetrical] n=1 Tax=Mya arenaria TaxID=6604 RepID=A0ABY7DUI5_MYAAR|nr:bis(5'-nucleosyl)-tetraphosphatase [asymmetrical]-like [Mya arenaria]WAR00338.1 AP4A-like protein [Mya arenaria]
MTSKIVVAGGLIVFRRITNTIEYLLLKASYGDYHWSPPKGHVDPGESELDAAVRETEEEAGLTRSQLTLHQDFQSVLNYKVRDKPKKVVYWLAELRRDCLDTEVKLSDEHTDYKWLKIKDAMEYAGYEDMKKSLSEADVYVQTKILGLDSKQ